MKNEEKSKIEISQLKSGDRILASLPTWTKRDKSDVKNELHEIIILENAKEHVKIFDIANNRKKWVSHSVFDLKNLVEGVYKAVILEILPHSEKKIEGENILMILSTEQIFDERLDKIVAKRYYSDDSDKEYRAAYFHRELDGILNHDIAYYVGDIEFDNENLEDGKKVVCMKPDGGFIAAVMLTRKVRSKPDKFISYICIPEEIDKTRIDLLKEVCW